MLPKVQNSKQWEVITKQGRSTILPFGKNQDDFNIMYKIVVHFLSYHTFIILEL